MKIYLDLCAIQRPLDTPNQVRIVLEAEAVLGILSLCDTGKVELVSSVALVYETELNPSPVRREHAYAVLSQANFTAKMTNETKARASHFMQYGIRHLDAMHLALAEASKVDYFCTCDDQLLQKTKNISDLHLNVSSPVDVVQEIEK